MTAPKDEGGQSKAAALSRREALRAGLLGSGLMLAVRSDAAGQPADAAAPAPVPPGVPVRPGLRRVAGEDITVYWRGKRCIHVRHCVTTGVEVFRLDGRWDLRGASADHIAHVIRQCPSGALTYERTDGAPQEALPHVNTARLFENGPLAVHADMTINGERETRATLCRCGRSANKPFCDGSHAAGFVATGEPPGTGEQKIPLQRAGRLRIVPLRNGPYQVTGNLEICAGTGRVVARTTQTTLCRCGGTGTPPFCDGSHVSIGFVAEGA